MDFVGKNKTVNITNNKKGKERIVEEVVTGSVREIFGKNEGDRSRNWLNEERKKFCFWIQWVFFCRISTIFLFYANFFAVSIILSGIQGFLLLDKIIICGNLHDHFKNWLLLNYAGLTYYFINLLLFDCSGLTKEELQESTEVNSFEL